MTYNPGGFLDGAFGWEDLLDDEFIETQDIKKNRHTFILGGSFTISF